ncbi:MAG: tetratricopeptide repeat protein [Candidatus Omnitrophica bacterium]|nr:tetratricopeptide repeat protein [Candidatus Omnitrophota bacterium]
MNEIRGEWFREHFLAGRRPYFWLAAVIVLLYMRTLGFGYTHLDDNILILKNQAFLSNIANIGRIFTQKVFMGNTLPYYRPVLITSFMLNAAIGGVNLFVYHLTNVALHILGSSLVFMILSKMGYRRDLSFLFSMAFAVHPILAQAVAWVPGRNDTLLAVCSFSSFLFFMDFADTKKWGYYAAHLACFFLGMLTKESAIIVIPVSFLYVKLIERDHFKLRNYAILAAGWLATLGIWFFLREAALRDTPRMPALDMLISLFVYSPSIIQYIGKAFFPLNLSVLPTIKNTTFLYGIAATALLAALVFRSKEKRANFVAFGLLWLILFLVPPLLGPNALFLNDMLEHRFYVAMLGLIIVFLETDIVKKFDYKKATSLAIAGAIIGLFSVIAFVHSGNFKDKYAFWQNACDTSPRSYFPRINLAFMHYLDGELDEAERVVKKTLEMEPQSIRSHYYLGMIYMKQGRLAEADREFRKEIALYPFYDNAYMCLGIVRYREGALADAEDLWKTALELNPDNPDALKNLSIYYRDKKEFKKAAYYVEELRKRDIEPPRDFLDSLGIK